uniref:Uncharacterized protein n=1 Tax=Sphaerodactylus townsendi TaxID=933632 RepID=A0ACB8FUQ7_9SAUR
MYYRSFAKPGKLGKQRRKRGIPAHKHQNVVCGAEADLIAFERSLRLPEDSEIRDILEEFMCRPNHSSEASGLRNRIHLVKESIRLLPSTIHRQHNVPVSIAEGYLGWQAIGAQLAETSTSCSKIMKFLSKTQSAEDASFSFCQEQLIQSLFWDTLDELWFGFEKNLYWKGLSTIIRKTCEMAYYANEGETFLRGQPEKTGLEHDEMNTTFFQCIADHVQEIFLPNSSVSLNAQDLQSFVETILDNVVFLMNILGAVEEDEDVQMLPKLAARILESFQRFPTFQHHHPTNVFLQLMEMFLREFDPKQPHVWRTVDLAEEVGEQLDALSRSAMPYGLENQKILNRSLQFFQHLLVDWPELNISHADYVNDLSEHFMKVLYETGLSSPEQTVATFNTIYAVKTAISLLVSNTNSSLKMQDLEKIVSNFYQKISRVGGNHAAQLVQVFSTFYQDIDQFLRQNNDSSVAFPSWNSQNISTPFLQLDFQSLSKASEFIYNTGKLLQDFPQKSFCEKLFMLYSYSELQVPSLVQDSEQETATTTSIMNNSKAELLGKERCIDAFQYLKTLFGLPTENSFQNVSSDFHISEFPPINHSNSFMLMLADLLSNVPPLGNSTNGSLSLNCTKAGIQTWLTFLEDVSTWLRLDSDFFTDFHKAFASSFDDLENGDLAKICNETIPTHQQLRSAVHLMKGISKVADKLDFEAWSHFPAILNHVINLSISYNRGDLHEAMRLMESVAVELHKAVSKANFSRDFLESWLDTFTPASSKLEHKLHSLGESISNILSWEEIQTSFVELRETAELLKNISQDENILSCAEILQNITQLMRDKDLSDQDVSQRWLPALLKYLLTFENATIGMKSCHKLGLLIKTFVEKYSFFYPGSVKDVLILLTSLHPFDDTSSKLENVPNILDVASDFEKLPCFQNGASEHLTNHCLNLVIKYLKLILPPFSEHDNLQEVDSVLALLNHTRGQIKSMIQYFKNYSLYAPDSNLTAFLEPIINSAEYLGFLHQFGPSLEGLSGEVRALLKNALSEYFQDGLFPWHTGMLLKALESLQKDIISFLRAPLHDVDGSSNSLSTTSHAEKKTSRLDTELARELLQRLMSYIPPSSVGKLDADILTKYMVALLQDLEKTVPNFSQLRQLSRNLEVRDHVGQYTEYAALDSLAIWFKNLTDSSPSWNSTSMRQIMKLFREAELTEIKQVLHFFLKVGSLFESSAHRNMTDVLVEGYHLMLNQSANTAALSMEDLSNEVNSLVELLEAATSMPLESGRALNCLAAVVCWNTTTRSSWDEPVSKACSVDLQKNASAVHEVAAEILEQIKSQGESRCSDERYLKEVTYKMACFLGQLEEWQLVNLTFSEIPPLDSSVLNELLTLWSQLSNYVLTSRADRNNLSHCMLLGKEQTPLQLMKAISKMISSEITAVVPLFEELADFYSGRKTERSPAALTEKMILTYLQHAASRMHGFNDVNYTLTSLLFPLYPPMALSSAEKKLHVVLKALLALAGDVNLFKSLETLWLETGRGINNLSLDFNVGHLLLLIAKEFHLLSPTVELNTLSALAASLRPLNTSFLQSFEGVFEHGRNWLEQHNNKSYSKIIHAVMLLVAGKSSSGEIIRSIKDIVSFLELFKNETNEDDPISFLLDFLSGKKLKNVHVAHLVLQNSLLNAIYDLTAKEEELYSNHTDNQIVEFMDLFFDDAQYENYGKGTVPPQSTAMQLIKDFLQFLFPSSTEHYGDKILFLLKDFHKDIIAEMRSVSTSVDSLEIQYGIALKRFLTYNMSGNFLFLPSI